MLIVTLILETIDFFFFKSNDTQAKKQLQTDIKLIVLSCIFSLQCIIIASKFLSEKLLCHLECTAVKVTLYPEGRL